MAHLCDRHTCVPCRIFGAKFNGYVSVSPKDNFDIFREKVGLRADPFHTPSKLLHMKLSFGGRRIEVRYMRKSGHEIFLAPVRTENGEKARRAQKFHGIGRVHGQSNALIFPYGVYEEYGKAGAALLC